MWELIFGCFLLCVRSIRNEARMIEVRTLCRMVTKCVCCVTFSVVIASGLCCRTIEFFGQFHFGGQRRHISLHATENGAFHRYASVHILTILFAFRSAFFRSQNGATTTIACSSSSRTPKIGRSRHELSACFNSDNLNTKNNKMDLPQCLQLLFIQNGSHARWLPIARRTWSSFISNTFVRARLTARIWKCEQRRKKNQIKIWFRKFTEKIEEPHRRRRIDFVWFFDCDGRIQTDRCLAPPRKIAIAHCVHFVCVLNL